MRLFPGQTISESKVVDAYIHDSLHYRLESKDLDDINGPTLLLSAKAGGKDERWSSNRRKSVRQSHPS